MQFQAREMYTVFLGHSYELQNLNFHEKPNIVTTATHAAALIKIHHTAFIWN